jgi:MoaA/NifB/PqqE/SkfB family radical SAM enzyme
MKKGSWRNRHMSVECFAAIVEHLPKCELGILHGIGEPTMHPDFIKLVQIAKSSGKFARLHCNTNALARDSAYYTAIIEAGLDSFSVSVDSLSSEIADLTRRGTPIDKLQRRLADFQKAGLPFVIQMVASRLNCEDIFFTLDTLNTIGTMTVIIQPYINHDEREVALNEEESRIFLTKLDDWKERNRNTTVHAGGFKSQVVCTPNAPAKEAICTAPWFDPGISADGFMTPCCVHWNPATLNHSSLAEKPFAELWTSRSVREFMQSYVAEPPDFCTTCSENVRTCSSKQIDKPAQELTNPVLPSW